jgi:hypothetical protein
MINKNKWETHITALRNFVARTGTTTVPRNHIEPIEENRAVPLGAWVSYVRHRYRKGHLSEAQVQELLALPNWQWGPFSPGRKSDSKRDAIIRQRHSNGETLKQIANEYSLTRQRVHQIVRADA